MIKPKYSTQEIINKIEAIHGKGVFDLSEFEYKGSTIPSKVICPKKGHGAFYPRPANLINLGSGCPKCGRERVSQMQRLTTEEYIKRSKEVHGEAAFDYSEAVYKTQKEKVTLICKACGHRFGVRISNHIHRESGCPKCADKAMGLSRQTPFEEKISRAKKIHGDVYDYSVTEDLPIMRHITIICPKEGHGSFRQTMYSHIIQGCGCPECGREQRAASNTWTQEQFLSAASMVHGDKYNYSKSDYKHNNKKVEIGCRKCGKYFFQSPVDHIHQKQGCPSCAKSGFDPAKPGWLYYLRISHYRKQYYKIGITNYSVEERFDPSDLKKIETLSLEYFEIGKDAQRRETAILKQFKKYKHKGEKILSSGNSEIFTQDIFHQNDEC